VRVLRQVVEDEPPPLRRLRPEIPEDLARVVRKCLAKDPARRYPSAQALTDDLDRWLAGRAVLAQPPGLGYRIGKLVQRRKAVVALAAASLLAAATAALSWLEGRTQRAASHAALALSQEVAAVLADVEHHRRLGEVERMRARLDAGIASCRAFLARHDVGHGRFLLSKLLRERAPHEAPAELDRAIALEPDLTEARVERGLSLARLQAVAEGRGETELALDLRARALADLERVLEHAPPGVRAIEQELARADLARLRGDFEGARAGYRAVLRRDASHAAAWLGLSRVALAAGDGEAARALAMSAVDVAGGLAPAYASAQATGGAGGPEQAEAAAPTAAAEDSLPLPPLAGWLVDFGPALAADPSNTLAHANRAVVRARDAARALARSDREAALEALRDAAAACRNALELEPSLAGAHNNAAVCALNTARLNAEAGRAAAAATERAAAARSLERALACEPTLAAAMRNRDLLALRR
jgi:hypothetical protein